MKSLLIKFVLTPIFYIYLAGLVISGTYFNWQYAQENGFIKWLVLGEIVPTIQSTIWPYYAFRQFMPAETDNIYQNGQQKIIEQTSKGQVIASFKERAWWLPYYLQLNSFVDKAGGTLSTSYRVGPGGSSDVGIQIKRGQIKTFLLEMTLPPEAIVFIDPDTGEKRRGKDRTVWTFRDHDLDGIPDDFFSKSFRKPISGESYTDDGFMIIRDSSDHSTILMQWFIGLAFSTNHFLYGKDSVYP